MKVSKSFVLILIILLGGLALRLVAATTLPLTNDEGSYLYDAYLFGHGQLPFLTSFSRAPALMVPLAMWLKIFGVSVFTGRLLAILASLGSAILLYFIGKELKNKTLGFWAFALYCLVSPVAIHGSYLLTQQFEIFYALAGSLLLVKATSPRLAVWSGLFFGLAIATRETALIYPGFLGVTLLLTGWRDKRAHNFDSKLVVSETSVLNVATTLVVAGITTILTWGLIWGLIASQVGLPHVIKNFEAILNMHNTGERLTLGFVMRGKLAEFWYLRVDYGILYLLGIVFAVLTIVKRWYKSRDFWILMAVAAGPLLFYGLYYKRIQPEYFASFMPGLALMGAWVVEQIAKSKKQITKSAICYLLFVIFLIADLLTFRYQLQNPRGGTFYLKPLDNVVGWIKTNTDPKDEIFTAAVSIPLLSGRHLALDISRPVLFGYPHIKPDIKYTLFPTPAEIMEYLTSQQVKYYVVEKSTRDSFYTGHDDLKKYLEDNYGLRERFENPTNPIELWERKV